MRVVPCEPLMATGLSPCLSGVVSGKKKEPQFKTEPGLLNQGASTTLIFRSMVSESGIVHDEG